MSNTLYQVYVLQNPVGRFYVGISGDIHHRLDQHNAGVSRWTSGKGPWRLVSSSQTMELSAARKLELFLKRQKGGDGFFHHTGLPRPSGS